VAELFGKSAGYILGYVKPNKSGFIEILAVDQRYRRQGIGKKLINLIMQRLKQKGVKEVLLHTRKKNRAANSFHKKWDLGL
jgi:ribosomal protein S18 acetylase RimI-like enzyme